MASKTKKRKKAKRKKTDTQIGNVKKSDTARLSDTERKKKRMPPPIWAVLCDSEKEVTGDQFRAWASHLAERNSPVSVRRLFGDIASVPLTWGLPSILCEDDYLLDFLKKTNKLRRKSRTLAQRLLKETLEPWLDERVNGPADVVDALECLAWAYAAPRIAEQSPASLWRALLAALLETAHDAEASLEATSGWTQMLVAGELPLVLAFQFPELPECRRFAKSGSQFVAQCLEQWMDGRGQLHASQIGNMRPLLATFTRSFQLAASIDGVKISKAARNEYGLFVQQALRVTRADLSSVMTPSVRGSKTSFTDFFTTALALTNDKANKAILAAIMHSHSPKENVGPDDRQLPNEPSYQSDWSESAVLQNGWAPDEGRFSIVYHDRQLSGELSVGKDIVFAGELMPNIRIDGALAKQTEDWECVCWFSDDDVDLLELRTDLAGGWALERQVLLARDDKFLLLADSISGVQSAKIDYECVLPLGPGISFEPHAEGREGYLKARRRIGLALPLGLPEWRAQQTHGELDSIDGEFVLRKSVEAKALHAPLFIDFHARRCRTTPTWRQLTVADQLRTVGPDEASAYRVQVGIEQWLIYRSMKPTISRTVLGQHFNAEFVCGRFLNDGSVEALVEINGPTSEAND